VFLFLFVRVFRFKSVFVMGLEDDLIWGSGGSEDREMICRRDWCRWAGLCALVKVDEQEQSRSRAGQGRAE
jgi:hypothetical protein